MVAIGSSENAPPLSACLAMFAILKGMIGAAILGMPFVFNEVGLAVAVPGTILVTCIAGFGVWRLLECSELHLEAASEKSMLLPSSSLSASRGGAQGDDDGAVNDYGLGVLATVGIKAFGNWGLALAAYGVLVSQLCVCLGYIDVIVDTLGEGHLLGDILPVFWLRVLLGMLLCFLMLLRRIENLAWLSMAALFVFAYLLFALIRWGTDHTITQWEDGTLGSAESYMQLWWPPKWSGLAEWYGFAIFAQEGMTMYIIAYRDMRLPSRWGFVPVLSGVVLIASVLVSGVGMLGVVFYGSSIRREFYLNFPKDSWDVIASECILCLVLLLTFILQMYPVTCFVENNFLKASDANPLWSSRKKRSAFGETMEAGDARPEEVKPASSFLGGLLDPELCLSVAFRWATVVLISVAAAYIPRLTTVASLGGCFSLTVIGFFLPALSHIKLTRGHLTVYEWLGDLLLLFCGTTGLIAGVVTAF